MSKTKKPSHQPNPWFAKNAKARHLAHAVKTGALAGMFRDDPNVVGMSFGQREAHGERTDEPALVVYVAHKAPRSVLPPSRTLPRRWQIGGDCIEIDVVQTGFVYPLAFTAMERPAPSGISVGNVNEASAGTLGCLVVDNVDGSLNILSNNHVLARSNAASAGETIVQPGVFDGGSAADAIATLNRFVMLNATGNTVDGAIARVTDPSQVVNEMKNGLMPIATPDHPAVGLLFAGGCNRTFMNPIRDVLAQLNIGFPGMRGAPVVDADVGLNVEKVGRTTEYTTSTVKEIDVSFSIAYPTFTASFDNQIATGWMSDRGDSGSLVCAGGEGSDIDNCGCGSQSTAARALGTNLKTEGQLAREIRDKYLRHTKIGRWAVNLFYLNEERFQDRFKSTDFDAGDVEFAKKMFESYREAARCAAAAPEANDQTVTKAHFRDASAALKRAKRYLSKQEADVADRLFKMAEQRLMGRTTRDALAMLQDDALLQELQEMAESLPSVTTKDCDCR
ncbi:MAG: hypothetical protein KC731_11830 [Myxococcales bacterium]|nr:hypothetical protein [Myxococcales bacterium]